MPIQCPTAPNMVLNNDSSILSWSLSGLQNSISSILFNFPAFIHKYVTTVTTDIRVQRKGSTTRVLDGGFCQMGSQLQVHHETRKTECVYQSFGYFIPRQFFMLNNHDVIVRFGLDDWCSREMDRNKRSIYSHDNIDLSGLWSATCTGEWWTTALCSAWKILLEEPSDFLMQTLWPFFFSLCYIVSWRNSDDKIYPEEKEGWGKQMHLLCLLEMANV